MSHRIYPEPTARAGPVVLRIDRHHPGRRFAGPTDDDRRPVERRVQRGRPVWVVVGDRGVIEPSTRTLGFGAVRLLNENGQPITARSE
ncbi:MAG: hypothetical protein GVY35_05890 [Bacteroidetes bacterium]|nr:hypothetical protein [Bacteroidota bacterium]